MAKERSAETQEMYIGAKHGDFLAGTYELGKEGGKFVPYKGGGEPLAAQLDPDSDKMALADIRSGTTVIHGSYKQGVFRPADESAKPGFIHELKLPDNQVYGFNYHGELINKKGEIIAALDKSGRVMNRQEYQKVLDQDIFNRVSAWRVVPTPRSENNDMEKIEKDVYEGLAERARNAGIPEERIVQYAQVMQRYTTELHHRKTGADESGLVKKIAALFALFSTALTFFFFSPNFTGFAVGDFTEVGANLFGVFFFLLSILLWGFCFHNK